MCDPVSIAAASTAISAATSVMKFQGQNRAWDDNRHAAGLTYASQFNALEQQRVQTQAQTSEDSVSNLIESLQAKGRISATVSDLGVDASSAAQQANAADFAAGRTQAITDLNADNQQLDYKTQVSNADLRRQGQIRQVSKASPVGLGLELAAAGLKGYSSATGGGKS